ncbi:MAG: hypothetical protein ACYTAF_15225, partial [Planctomycetota bacterium]
MSVSGTIEVVAVDRFGDGACEIRHLVVGEDGKPLRLKFAGEVPAQARAGAKVKVRGKKNGMELAVGEGGL